MNMAAGGGGAGAGGGSVCDHRLFESQQLSPNPHPAASLWWPEVSHGGSIYTPELARTTDHGFGGGWGWVVKTAGY